MPSLLPILLLALLSLVSSFRYAYVVQLTVTVNRPVSRDHFFNPRHPWYHELLVLAFNRDIVGYLAATGATGPEGLHSVQSVWKTRQTLVSTLFLDQDSFENAWNFIGSNAGARSIVQILNGVRADNTYEFVQVSTASQRNYQEHCLDQRLDGNESYVDCGGSCIGCAGGQKCYQDYDCLINSCHKGVCYDAVNAAPRFYTALVAVMVVCLVLIVI